jgi:hypothetical protein
MARDTGASEALEFAVAVAGERPPLWAQAMQQQMDQLQGGFAQVLSQIHVLSIGFAGLQEDVANLKADVTDMKKTTRLAYCRPGLLPGLVRDPDACAALLGCCSNLADTSLMSKSEITADFVANDRGAGLVADVGGDCQYASGVALEFFERRKIMNARAEAGVMHSPSGAPIAMGVASGAFAGGGLPPAQGDVRSGALAYRLAEGCLWTRDPGADAAADPLQPRVGCKHYVVSVDTLDCERVVVDWGIKQFGEIPADMRLFI